ncbi:uroporphyrinogen-III synthase [Nakamurella antarctica]|uniref:Uroporphyrinogen-III synthase n=1 Tax=Nakamurella antarctica TaxID=1902245 RepID=A0A3G8ZXQ9_9ACTN|nr:uroporphyrinogen-III synthase [Nakamurella antarctica]AZI58431.1 uroporphyrinogen-III synthase [Nakamurella antarctica]
MTNAPGSAAPGSAGPLAGWRVLVGRGAGELVDILADAGATVSAVPLIQIAQPVDRTELDAAAHRLAAGDFQWVGVTSANGVAAVANTLSALKLAIPAKTQIAAVGPATLGAARAAGWRVDLSPTEIFSGAALAACWPAPALGGASVLLPSSQISLGTLAAGLTQAGYTVERLTAYLTLETPPPAEVVRDLESGQYDAVLLTSPSTVRALTQAAIPSSETVVGCIGVTTAAAARDAGLTVTFTAAEATASALADGLISAAVSFSRSAK